MKFNFCPKCAGKLDNNFKLESGGDFVPKCAKCGFLFFQNSKPTASVVPITGKEIILAKRAVEPQKGKYDVIGGFTKENEDPITGAKREFFEETGIRISNLNFVGIYVGSYGNVENLQHTFNVIYSTNLSNKSNLEPKDDVESFKKFSLQSFKDIPIAFSYLEKMLNDLKKIIK